MAEIWWKYVVAAGESSYSAIDGRLGYSDGVLLKWEDAWNDRQNKPIRDLRHDPDKLQPGDTIYFRKPANGKPPIEPGYEWGEYTVGEAPSIESAASNILPYLKKKYAASTALVYAEAKNPRTFEALYKAPENAQFHAVHEPYRYGTKDKPPELTPPDIRFKQLFPGEKLYVRVKKRPPPVTNPVATQQTNTCTIGTTPLVDVRILPTTFTATMLGVNKLRDRPILFEFDVHEPLSRLLVTVKDGSNLIYTETIQSGGRLSKGNNHAWSWDGYANTGPTAGVLDTKVLRKDLLVTFTATRADPCERYGCSVFISNKTDEKEKGYYLDLLIDTVHKRVKATFYVNCAKLSAGDIAKYALAMQIAAVPLGPLGTPVGAIVALIGATHQLNGTELGWMRERVRDGVKKHWRRVRSEQPAPEVLDHPCKVTLDGEDYDFESEVSFREHGALEIRALKEVNLLVYKWDRGLNLGVSHEGLHGEPIFIHYPEDPAANALSMEKTAAHELGHSVLYDAFGQTISVTHKGSTGGAWSQEATATQESYPEEPREIDLMQYYNKPGVTHYYERVFATESDALALISIVTLKDTDVMSALAECG